MRFAIPSVDARDVFEQSRGDRWIGLALMFEEQVQEQRFAGVGRGSIPWHKKEQIALGLDEILVHKRAVHPPQLAPIQPFHDVPWQQLLEERCGMGHASEYRAEERVVRLGDRFTHGNSMRRWHPIRRGRGNFKMRHPSITARSGHLH